MEYIAFINKENNDYVAVVPDLNYTSSYGETFDKAVHYIIEACELYCEDLKNLPKASSLEELQKTADLEKDAFPQLINIKVEKNVRINVILANTVLKMANKKAKETHNGKKCLHSNTY